MSTVMVIIFRTFNVRHSFEVSKVKFIKAGPSFVGVIRLVTGLSEGKERL